MKEDKNLAKKMLLLLLGRDIFMVGMKSHLQYNIFNDDAGPSEKISTRLHGRGVETTPHNFGTP